jgi:hypothetical protein
MAGFADEPRAGTGQPAREMAGARLAGDDYGAGVWRERLSYLEHVARRHGVALPAARPAEDPE